MEISWEKTKKNLTEVAPQMAPATEECNENRLIGGDEASPDDVSPPPGASDWRCCRCCSWQRRKHRPRPPRDRGVDKVGTSDNDTLLAGGKTRFYCCDSKKMISRPSDGQRQPGTSNTTNPSAPRVLTATPVSPDLCSVLRRRGRNSNPNQSGQNEPPIDIAFDALDENAYFDEFEFLHQEDYDVSHTVYDPVAPYIEILKHPSQVGRAIIIEGIVAENAQRFAINLGCRENNDIALHFNPRLDRGYVARNTKLNGFWGDEENSLNGPCPFQCGQPFRLHILVTEDCYRFSHNGRHICSYNHRVPIARLHKLDIHGDLSLSLVRHEMMDEYPPPLPDVSLATLLKEPEILSSGHTALILPTTQQWRSNIPLQANFFLGRFEPNIDIGTEIIIGGIVRLLPRAFFINLQTGTQMWRPPEVHFHLNPRFGSHEGHNEIVLNARLKGAWGFEERHLRCQFEPGMPFIVTIIVEAERYRTFVNGCHLASMDHRARPVEVNSLYISGDVSITSVGIKPASKSSLKTSSTGASTKQNVTIIDDDWVDLTSEKSTSTSTREKATTVDIDWVDLEENRSLTVDSNTVSVRTSQDQNTDQTSSSLQLFPQREAENSLAGLLSTSLGTESFDHGPGPSSSTGMLIEKNNSKIDMIAKQETEILSSVSPDSSESSRFTDTQAIPNGDVFSLSVSDQISKQSVCSDDSVFYTPTDQSVRGSRPTSSNSSDEIPVVKSDSSTNKTEKRPD